MKIDNLKQLQQLIKLCRQTGIEAIEVDGIKMNLGPTPVIYKAEKKQLPETTIAPGGITEDIQIPTNGLTEEQLLYYSAQSNDVQ